MIVQINYRLEIHQENRRHYRYKVQKGVDGNKDNKQVD